LSGCCNLLVDLEDNDQSGTSASPTHDRLGLRAHCSLVMSSPPPFLSSIILEPGSLGWHMGALAPVQCSGKKKKKARNSHSCKLCCEECRVGRSDVLRFHGRVVVEITLRTRLHSPQRIYILGVWPLFGDRIQQRHEVNLW
jgi:hypothetical protein